MISEEQIFNLISQLNNEIKEINMLLFVECYNAESMYIPYIQIYLFDEELGKQFGIFIDKSLLASLSINKLEFDLRKEILNRYDEREGREISI